MNEESGARNEERAARIEEKEVPGTQYSVPRSDEARLEIISKSIKGIAAMSQVGITYCIVIPGHGVREDCRLGSNFIAPPIERSAGSVMNEVNGNIEAILVSYMNVIRKMGHDDSAAEGLIDEIVKTAKRRFEQNGSEE